MRLPTPRHATNPPPPVLLVVTAHLRQAWDTATARDVPTSTPSAVGVLFQRTWRAS